MRRPTGAGLLSAVLVGLAVPFLAQPAVVGHAGRVPALEDMVRTVERAPLEKGTSAVGSGFFIAPSLVLTSAHVLAGCRTIAVTNARIGTMPARLETSEPRRDSAVLRVEGARAPHLRWNPRPALAAGDRMTIVGFPAERAGTRSPVAYPARFQGSRRDEAGVPVLELAADLASGASGAPVLDAADRLAGIVVGRLDIPPRDVIALSLAGLSGRTRGLFAEPVAAAGRGRPDAYDRTNPNDAVVKIHCR